MEQLLIASAVFVAVLCVGGALLLALAARRRPVERRLRRGTPAAAGLRDEDTTDKLGGALGKIGSGLVKGKPSVKLEQQMAQAGYTRPNAVAIYFGAKALLLLIGLVASAALLLPTGWPMVHVVVLTGVISLTLFFLPNLVVYAEAAKRAAEIRGHLPDAMDLLEICVSSGMGLETAWNAVANEFRGVSTPLADEMALVNLELHLGATRAEAMRHMAVRTGAKDISSLVAILVQSERFGTSIASALQTFAEAMRQDRKQRARESAEKAAVKLLVPMIFCIFPAILVVLIGPAGMRIWETFGSW